MVSKHPFAVDAVTCSTVLSNRFRYQSWTHLEHLHLPRAHSDLGFISSGSIPPQSNRRGHGVVFLVLITCTVEPNVGAIYEREHGSVAQLEQGLLDCGYEGETRERSRASGVYAA